VRVPEDLAVVGYADLEYSHMLRVPLTTIQQPTDAIARCASDLLMAKIEGREVEQTQVKLPVKLMVRASTSA